MGKSKEVSQKSYEAEKGKKGGSWVAITVKIDDRNFLRNEVKQEFLRVNPGMEDADITDRMLAKAAFKFYVEVKV